MIEKFGDRFGVEPICRVLGYASASTYYARRAWPPGVVQAGVMVRPSASANAYTDAREAH